ncbi:MAG: DUF1800 family protein [Verrucomicrobiaceae bacterium]|nr:DUF1800 family protein [Verrucomicrobiaceae bacterium]
MHPRTLVSLLSLFLAVTQTASAMDFFSTGPGQGGPDNMSDVWQAKMDAWGLDPNGDEDSDGCSNLVESIAGTDPRNPADCTKVGNTIVAGNTIVFTFDAEAGKKYRVKSDSNPTGAFSTIENITSPVTDTEYIPTADNPSATITITKSGTAKFYRIETDDVDSDGDGASDWEERETGTNPNNGFSPGNASGGAANDGDTLRSLLSLTATAQTPNGYERADKTATTPVVTPAVVRLSRSFGTMPLNGLTLDGSGGAPDATKANASTNDFANPGTINIPNGATTHDVSISPVQDSTAEVPEFLKVTINLPTVASPGPSATVCMCDANPTLPANNQLYVAFLGHEAGEATTASGYATALVNGDNTSASVSVVFNNLSSEQNTAYIRYGPNNDLAPALPNGQVSGFGYNVVYKPGFLSTDQAFLDALRNSDLWCAVTSANFPAKEIAGPFQLADGSETFTEPAEEPATGSGAWATTTTDQIERDIWRFMGQATFGGTTALYNEIRAKVDTRIGALSGSPTAAQITDAYLLGLEDWMDDQMNSTLTPSINFQKLVMAADNEEFALRGNKPSTYFGDPQINNATYQLSYDAQGMPFLPSNTTANNNNFGGNYPQSGPNRRREWWTIALQAKDQLRQRMALALSEIVVISEADQTILDRHYGCANYWDMLATGAFGKYRSLLEQVTYSPMMGIYLSHMSNRARYEASPGLWVSPDENYAREIMQLFSIGLVLRHPDGSLMLDGAGLPIPTYDNNDITELARVMTGFSHGARHANAYYSSFSGSTLLYNNYSASDMSDQIILNYASPTNFQSGNNVWFGRRDGQLFWPAPWVYPMKVMGRISDATGTPAGSIYYHDFDTYLDPVSETPVPGVSKRLFAGKHAQYDIDVRVLPALGRGANDITCHNLAAQDLTDAHNVLAGDPNAATYPAPPSGPGPDAGFESNPGHTNTPINISRWLIQRLVTSNPSNGYIYRVQNAYRASNGNLGTVLKAILLDFEARSLQLADTAISHGKVKEPLVAFAQMLRAFRAFSGAPLSILRDNTPPFGSGETPMPEAYPATEFNKFSNQNVNPPALPNGWAQGPFRYRFGDLTANIGQSPQRAPSVFNWFLPDFVVPGPMAQAGLFAPELQINTEASVVAKVNMFYNFTWSNLTGMSTQPGSDANVADFTLSNAWATPAVLFSLDGGKTFTNSLTFNASNWNSAQTITVIAADTPSLATLDNSLLRFSVSGAGSGYDALPVLPVNVSTTDNELRNEGIRVEETGFSTWVQEGGATDTVNVRLTSPPPTGATVTINLSTSNGQASVSPTTLNFTSANWDTAQPATISAVQDGTTEASGSANSALIISSTSATAAWNGLTAPSFVINVADDNDGANSYGIIIAESGGSTIVAETINTSGAGTDSFTIVLAKQPTASVTITILPVFGQLGIHNGTSFVTTAITRTFTTTTNQAVSGTTSGWNVPQTVVVRGNDDNTADNDWPENPLHYGSLVVYGTGGGYDAVKAQTVVVPVSETAFTVSTTNDNRIMISHGGSDASETRVSEDGTITDTITVALRAAPQAGVPVTVTLGSGQLSCTPDHIVFNNTNYSTPVTVTVKAIDDHFAEGLHVSERQGLVNANAVQAFATCTISGGAVNATTITGRGYGYASAPQVTFAPSPTGVFATGTAVLNALGQVASINITSGGSGYVSAPSVTIAAPPNSMPLIPTAISTIASGAVNNVIVTSGGGGYSSPPLVFFSGAPAGGTTASGYGQINAQGQLTNIVVTNAGAGYITAPTISFYEPPHGQATIVATATSDNVADNNYNNYWARTHSSLYCTVIDNDLAALVVNQSGGSTSVNENGTTDTVGFSLSQQPSANVTVTLTPTNQVLVNNTTLPTTLTFTTANWGTEQTVTVAAVNDATVEGDLGANIGVGIVSNDTAFGGLKAKAIPVTVIDNDFLPLNLAHANTWTIVAEGAAAGNSDASTVRLSDTFTVSLPRTPTSAVTVTLVPDANVTVSPSTLNFTAANVAQTVTVTAVDDAALEATNHEASIRFQISSADPSYSNNAMYPWPVQVIDNDSYGVAIVQSDLFTTPTETSTDTYTVRLTRAPGGNVVVRATSPAPAELLVNSATSVNLTFTTTNWATPQTITVTAVGDGVIEGRELFNVTHDIFSTADATNYPTSMGISPVTVYNTDNFRRNEGMLSYPAGGGITVNASTPNSGTLWTAEGGGYMDTVDVYLTGKPINDVVVYIFPSIPTGQVAQVGTDKTTLVFNSTNWNIPQTVQVMALDDSFVEPHHISQGITFQAQSSDPLYQFVSATPTVYIVDNDTAGVIIEQSGNTTNTTEGGATDTYTVRLNRAPNGTVVIEPRVNTDTTVSPTSLTFDANNWNTPQSVTVTAFNDTGNERNEVSNIGHWINPTGTTDTTGFALQLLNCNTTISITTVTCASTVGLYAGMPISGPNINPGTTISSISNSTTFVLSGSATATTTTPITLTAGIQHVPNFVTDNDDLVAVSHVGLDTRVHEDGSLSDTVQVTLRRAPTGGSTVTVTAAVPANQGYAASPTVLTFNSSDWNTVKTINITGVNNNNFTDRLHSANLTFTSAASGGSPNDTAFNLANNVINQIPVFVATVDTPQVVVSESSNSTNLNEGGATDTVSYILSHQPTGDVTVTITCDSQLEVAGLAVNGVLTYGPTATLTFTTTNWNVYQAATFRAKDDLVTESNSLLVPHLGWVTNSATSGDPQYNGVTMATFPALIIDNEVPGAVLSHTGGTTIVAEGGTGDTYTVVLTRAPTADVTVNITPDADATVSPTSLTFNTGNWSTPQIVTVNAAPDTDIESLHTATIGHSFTSADPIYSGHPAPNHIATVYDDDGNQLVVNQTGGTTVLTEGPNSSGWDTFTLALSQPPTGTVTISLIPPMYYIPPAPYSKQYGYYTSDLSGSNQQRDRVVLDYTEINLLYRSTFYGYLTSVYGSNIPNPPTDAECQSAHWAAAKAVVDKLDLWFNGGSLKARYPVLKEPNQAPPTNPEDALHPRQVILEAIFYHNGASNNPSTTRYMPEIVFDPKVPPVGTFHDEIRDRCRWAGYLMTTVMNGFVAH